MSIPLVATKLYVPPLRPKVVHRPHLIARLNAGLHGKLTLISAPAGFGKTTLVSEWIHQKAEAGGRQGEGGTAALHPSSFIPHPAKVAWLSLDEGDNDLARFLTYFVAALQTLGLGDSANAGRTGVEGMGANFGAAVLRLLQSPQPPSTDVLLTTLLNEITTITDRFMLVLDDYHVLAAAPNGAVDQALTFLLEHLPPQMHLVITTREDPSLPLARYRARGQMTEVRAADLRFTAAEAAGFLNQVMDLNLAAEDVAVLEARTEGWIAGLQLAALSLSGSADVSQFVKAFAGNNRYIVDYLVEEVLQRQPERVRRFLRQTAILDRLCGPLCDAVTNQQDSLLLLDTLERGNLFVVPLDNQRQWFRYHHLFADVLAAGALMEQPAQVPLLHQRASAWYAANGLFADAIRHALAAKDFVCAAGLIERAWPAMDGSFQTATWLGWARAIPDEVVRIRPVLRVTYAWAMLNGGELEAAEARLIAVEQWLETGVDTGLNTGADGPARLQAPAMEMIVVDEAQFRTLPASIATARAYLAQSRGDLPVAVKYGQRALDLLPETDYLRRGPAAALLGLAQWASGDLEAAYRTLAAAMAGFQKVGNLHFATSVTSGLADIRTVQGRLHDAIRCYTQALQLALAPHPEGTRPLIRGTANLYLGLSELYHEQGHLALANEYLLRTEELGDQAGLPDWRYRLCRAQARFQESQGDWAGALERLDAAERNFRSTPVPAVRPLGALRARVWVAQGRLREAQRWVQEQGLAVDDELSFLREFDHITLAQVLLAEYARNPVDHTIREALHLLVRLQQAAEAGGRLGSVIEIGVLQALAYQAQGNLAPALVMLERTLRLAEPENYVRIFVDKGLPMAQLLTKLKDERGGPGLSKVEGLKEYIHSLLAAFGKPDPLPLSTISLPPAASSLPPLVEPLSPREVEVLQLIAQGLSNQEISEKLFLALSTVKGHNRLIFDKLQVQRRTEAVARARELGLV